MRQVVLADDDLDVNAEITRIPENLDNSTDCMIAALGKLEQFGAYHHAVQVLD